MSTMYPVGSTAGAVFAAAPVLEAWFRDLRYFARMNGRNPWFLLLLVLLLATAAQLVMPWWSVALVAFVVAFVLAPTGRTALVAGFGGAALSWWLPAAWLTHQNGGLLAHRMAQLLPLGGSPVALVAVAGVVAGLVGGLAALAGTWLRAALRPAVPLR